MLILGRTGHHGGDGDGNRYMGGARIQKKENGSLQPQQEEKGRTHLPRPGWRMGFGRLFHSPMSMLSDSRPKAAHRCFSPIIR